MATSPNYGWTEPDNTGLVKNGAQDMRTLGNAIDEFLFRPFARNGVINSDFSIWQRGTSFTASGPVYAADRWNYSTFGGGANQTVTRQLTNDTTNLPNIQYCIRYQRNSGTSLTGAMQLAQSFETVNSIPYAGKTITFSFYARRGANYSSTGNQLQVVLFTGTGTDQNRLSTAYTGEAKPVDTNATLTTTWQRFQYSANIGSTVTEITPYFASNPTGTAGANDYYEVTGVQLEVGVGGKATPYCSAGFNAQAELAMCQRYFQTYGTNAYGEFTGQFYSTTAARFTRPLLVALRTSNPTVTFPTGTFTNYIEEVGVANRTPTAFASNGASSSHITFSATGMTGATTNTMAAWTTSAAAITISAEL